jgi:hypothetical protein
MESGEQGIEAGGKVKVREGDRIWVLCCVLRFGCKVRGQIFQGSKSAFRGLDTGGLLTGNN